MMARVYGKLLLLLLVVVVSLCCLGGCSGGIETTPRDRGETPPAIGRKPTTSSEQIVCNRFEISKVLSGQTLELAIDTDLPDYTDVIVSVSRCYYEKGNDARYSLDYFSKKGTVDQWRKPRTIVLDNAKWKADLEKKQQELAVAGLAGDISRLGDKVEIYIVVPYNQSHPAFGEKNKNLRGDAVTADGDQRIVKQELSFDYPIGQAAAPVAKWGDPQNLARGQTYRLSKQTPLMPELEPVDPMAAIGKIRQIDKGGTITIVRTAEKRGIPWYFVSAKTSAGRSMGKGWVNSIALLGQQLAVVE